MRTVRVVHDRPVAQAGVVATLHDEEGQLRTLTGDLRAEPVGRGDEVDEAVDASSGGVGHERTDPVDDCLDCRVGRGRATPELPGTTVVGGVLELLELRRERVLVVLVRDLVVELGLAGQLRVGSGLDLLAVVVGGEELAGRGTVDVREDGGEHELHHLHDGDGVLGRVGVGDLQEHLLDPAEGRIDGLHLGGVDVHVGVVATLGVERGAHGRTHCNARNLPRMGR